MKKKKEVLKFKFKTYQLTLFIGLSFFLCSNIIFAQSVKVIGKLVDSQSQQPVSFAQVALFKSSDDVNPVVFSDSDEKGAFQLEVKPGTYTFKAFFLGYEDLILETIQATTTTNLGNLSFESSNQNLEEVVVETSQLPVRTTLEGLIVTPANNLANAGGTLLDILRNTPSVSVSEDGGISLRGSSATNILINGRNSSLTQNLDQLPASVVEEIKIINNPNARYDAEAEGGVIDIVLKKGIELGTHGGVEGTYGTRGRSNVGGRINHRNLKMNVFGGYNYRNWRSVGERQNSRRLFDEQEDLDQTTRSSDKDVSNNLNFGLDLYFGENTLSYEGVLQVNETWDINTLFANQIRKGRDFDYVRRNNENEQDDGLDNALIFEHRFKEKDHVLRATASHSFRNQYKTQNIEIFNGTQNPIPENLSGRERAFTDEVRNISVAQIDYIRPLDKGKFESGLKSTIREFDNDFIYQRFNESTQTFVDDSNVSNRFLYQDQIHAAYAIYSNSGSKFEYGLGLRGEFTQVDTYLFNSDEENQQRYFNLFPSIQGLYNLNEIHGVKFTYSRRIDRPRAWRLNPFPNITDSLNVRRGNPNLVPEMINSFEFGHLANFEKTSLTTNLFYRKINNQIDFITIIEDGISYTQPENLRFAEAYGVELIGTAELNEWYSLNGGMTFSRIVVNASNISEEFTNDGFTYNAKLNQDFKLPKGFNFQLVANYESPEIQAQGKSLSVYYVDTSIQKSFFENRGSLTLAVRDVFDTRRYAGSSLTNTFSQEYFSKDETRIVLLSARYNF
ncbi:Outer membrane receptor proteins, mostly Fe transport [Algoriphagus ornithinivorans]|uniref:Outer membrane receptor proteins, mostly Fe transport n=1 Tax=Algoriphagus ornithinivorans TaxID=226506 RepID=A0A1I5J4M8_9BACT|nr:outer membrane beta-barrel family protein [Algoriphagus ornithinivorans]SFO67346.1 Outer membrane receptor proteins, mostly Fe transport [Algoriphagus ornithinivorans]